MAHRVLIFAAFLCCSLVSVGARAQALAPQTAKTPRQTETPQTPVGLGQAGAPQTIILPKILVAGEKATLAVLDASGRLVPAVAIDLSTGAKVITDDTGRATFLAPGPGILTASITETGQPFTTAVLAIPLTVAPSTAAIASSPRLIAPRLIALQDRFDLLGSGFSGQAYLDSVVLGNLPALVLAASPISLVVQANPQTGAGQAELVAGLDGSRLATLPVTVVSLQVIGPAKPIAPGEMSTFTVRVNGSSQRLIVQVRSLTPGVVSLPRGDSEYWFTTGGSANVATVKLRGGKPGNYSLSARLVSSGAVNIESARQQLLAARQVANPQWQKALDQLTRHMAHDVANGKDAYANHAARRRQDIERLLRSRPQEPLASLLRMAWQSLGTDAD